ncbi:DnaD domain protein [Paludifilum halophilum]|uniref:Uncharacterized protein n=1 Tax=Paludifilum halophilum TaxID=1642702 RepID=A0A235B913_9BACL|nr:DnaD domain protein [Paludifilum halophilum]OYD08377.1 hypothetical protein CHM34_05950 [Paludifilum halophilum]
MSISWKECTPRDGWRTRSCRPIHAADVMGLLHLYQPMVGTTAVGLYMTLYYQLPLHQAGISQLQTHLDLMKLLQLSLDELLQARYRLEGVGLVNTYRYTEKERRIYEYEVVPPLMPARFFQSDVLSISLLNRLGKDHFRALYREMTDTFTSEEDAGRKTRVTKTFQQVFGSISPADVASAKEVDQELSWHQLNGMDGGENGQSPSFEQEEDDLAMVRARLENLLDDRAWTEEVEKQVREIRFLYQLDDWDLIRALQNPYVTQNGKIAVDRLRSFVKSQYRMRFGSSTPVVVDRKQLDSPRGAEVRRSSASKGSKGEKPAGERPEEMSEEERHFRALAAMSPLELLTYFQKGKQIPQADVELVERLQKDYGLTPGVINVLLEYVLYTHDYKLPRSLVEKIAGHWARKSIKTVEEAREMARNELNWEWKKRKKSESKSSGGRKWSPWNRQNREDQLPRAVVKSMDQRSAKAASDEWEADPETEAQIQAKIERMHQRLNSRLREKGN